MNGLLEAFLRWLGELIYEVLQLSQEGWFRTVAFIWLLIGIIYDLMQQKSFLKGLHLLLSYPLIDHRCRGEHSVNISDMDSEESVVEREELFLYPRQFLEELSCRLIDALTFPGRRWVYPVMAKIAHAIYPWQKYDVQSTFLSIIFAIFLIFFAYGDTIAIANALDALGLVQGEIPEAFLYYERAVAAASFFAIIVGFFVLLETAVYVSKSRSQVTNDTSGSDQKGSDEENLQDVFVDVRSPEMARLMQGLSLIIIFVGVAVSILLGIGRLMALGYWEGNTSLSLVVQFGVNVLTLVNGILAAALVFLDGIRGLRVFLALIVWGLVGVLLVTDFIGFVGVRILTFVLDYIWRLVLMVIYLGIVIIFRPPEFLIRKTILGPFNFIKKFFER